MRSIDLISFLSNYYGIVNDSLKVNKLTHIDIKILFPYIRRTSFESIKYNESKIYNGEVIMVHDCKGQLLPYINPYIKVETIMNETNNYEDVKIIDIDENVLNNLSKEELLKLRKKLKKNHQYIDERNVTEKIRRKKDPKVKQYKRKKLMLRMEEFE